MMRYHSTSLRVAIAKKSGKNTDDNVYELESLCILLEMRIEITLWETIQWLFTTLNIKLSYDQAILFLNIHPKEWKEGTQTDTYIPAFKESLFTIEQSGNQTVCDHIIG